MTTQTYSTIALLHLIFFMWVELANPPADRSWGATILLSLGWPAVFATYAIVLATRLK